MIRVELRCQLARIRTMIALAALAGMPLFAGLATASNAGRRNGNQGGLFGTSTYSALNHAAASLQFIEPLLLPLIVALLCTAIGSSDREWGILRYLYIQPVSPRRLLVGKLGAAAIATAAATGAVLLGGLLTGLILFGWHPMHVLDAPTLGTGESITRFLTASGYALLCMLSIGAIALALGLAMPRGAEALGVSVAFVIIASILNGQHALHALTVILPVHYWQDWTRLFEASHAHLGAGVNAQLGAIAAAATAAAMIIHQRDPAA